KQWEQEVVLRVLLSRFADRERSHFRNSHNRRKRHDEACERSQKQRNVVVNGVGNEQSDEWNQRESADPLRASAQRRHRSEHVVNGELSLKRLLVAPSCGVQIVPVEAVSELVADEMPEQDPPDV